VADRTAGGPDFGSLAARTGTATLAERTGPLAQHVSLVDTVDHLLNRGVVLVGETTISLAGVDLIYLGLNLLVSSVETLQSPHPPAGEAVSSRPASAPLLGTGAGPSAATGTTRAAAGTPAEPAPRLAPARDQPGASSSPAQVLAQLPERLKGETGERPERGLARLVLTLVEVLRQVLERQAVRRMEGGGLADEEIERMGQALMELEAKMVELRTVFGLTEDDLNLDLGPLGELL
jgi:hypothetical protein